MGKKIQRKEIADVVGDSYILSLKSGEKFYPNSKQGQTMEYRLA